MDKQNSSNINEFKYESFEERNIVIQMLDALATGITKKKISLKNSEDEITLQPQGLIHADFRVKSQNGRSKITVHFTWTEK